MVNANVELLVMGLSGMTLNTGYSGNTGMGSIDFDGNEVIQMNFSVADVTDITQKTGSFSESFTVPGTKNNNEIFNFIFEIGANSTFNPAITCSCQLLVDTIPVLANGIMQLVSINIDNQGEITYNINVFDQVLNFANTIGASLVEDLNWSDLNHTWDYNNVTAGWNVPNIPYYYSLIDYGYGYTKDSLQQPATCPITNMYPAVQIKQIWDRTFSAAGYSYTSDFINSEYFENLYSPYLSQTGLQLPPELVVAQGFKASMSANSNTLISTSPNTNSFNFNFNDLSADSYGTNFPPLSGASYIQQGSPSITGGTYSAGTNSIQQFVLELGGQNFQTATPGFYNYLDISLTVTWYRNGPSGNGSFGQAVKIFRNNSSSFSATTFNYTFFSPQLGSGVGLLGPLLPSDEVFFLVDCPVTATAPEGSGPINPYTASTTLTAGTWYNIVNPQVPAGGTIYFSNAVPLNYKQQDFINDMVLMHNLYIATDPNNPKNFIVEPRDVFYSGTTYYTPKTLDWSSKLDSSQSVLETLLSEQTNQRVVFSYTPDSDYFNNLYSQSTNHVFGDFYYTIDNQFVTGDQNMTCSFSPTPSVCVANAAGNPFGNNPNYVEETFIIPKIGAVDNNGSFGNCNANRRILQRSVNLIEMADVTDYWLLDGIPQYAYPFLGMLNSVATTLNPAPTIDISFGAVQYEFFALSSIPSNNLTSAYWSNYLQQLSDPESKLINCYMYLTPADIQNFDFRNTIYIDGLTSEGHGGYFLVNSITYIPTANAPSQVELIQVTNKYVPITQKSIKNIRNNTTNTNNVSASNISSIDNLSTNTLTLGWNLSIGQANEASSIIGTGISLGGGSQNSSLMGTNINVGGGNQETAVFGSNVTIGSNSPNSIVFGDNNSIGVLSPSNMIVGDNNSVASGVTGAVVFGNGITATTGNTVWVENLIIQNGTLNGIPITSLTGSSSGSTATSFTGGTVTGATNFTGGLTSTTISATTYYNLPPTSFSGGTVSGPTNFTAGLTSTIISATTISATTFYGVSQEPFLFVTANTTVTTANYGIEVSGSVATTIFMPSPIGISGQTFVIKNIGQGQVTVTGITSSINFDTNSNLIIPPYGSYTLISDNKRYDIVGEYDTYVFVTGATYNASSGVQTLKFNNGTTALVSGFFTGATTSGNTTYVTTLSSTTITSSTITTGTVSATTYTNLPMIWTAGTGSGSAVLSGSNSTATGNFSVAIGSANTATGLYSFAEGYSTTAGTANNIAAHSEGYQTQALGYASHAEGYQTYVAQSNIALGNYDGAYSHAGGYQTIASGNTSFVHSNGGIVNGDYSAILGGQYQYIPTYAVNSIILGGNSLTALTSNYVYVPSLNVNVVGSSPSIYNLGIDINGNLTRGQTGNILPQINLSGHSITTPTNAGTVNLLPNTYNIINPSGSLTTLTVNLPNSPTNNMSVYIKYTKAIVTVTYANGTVSDGITAPIIGTLVVLVYDSSTSIWY